MTCTSQDKFKWYLHGKLDENLHGNQNEDLTNAGGLFPMDFHCTHIPVLDASSKTLCDSLLHSNRCAFWAMYNVMYQNWWNNWKILRKFPRQAKCPSKKSKFHQPSWMWGVFLLSQYRIFLWKQRVKENGHIFSSMPAMHLLLPVIPSYHP